MSVYLHSWNPEASNLLDRLYSPAASLHEHPIGTLDKVASQHLSLKRCLALLAAAAATPDLVMVARYDLIFYSDLLVKPLLAPPKAADALWLPQQCMETAVDGVAVQFPIADVSLGTHMQIQILYCLALTASLYVGGNAMPRHSLLELRRWQGVDNSPNRP